MRNQPNQRQFQLLASHRTTVGLSLTLFGLLAFGMFVPQQVSMETIGYAYDPSLVQTIQQLDLHRIGESWLVQLTSLMLVVNLCGRFLWSLIGGGRLPEIRNDATIQRPISLTSRVDQSLQSMLPKWKVQLESSDTARAQRGFRAEGFALVGIGILVLVSTLAYSQATGTQGRLRILTGHDDQARSRYQAEQYRNGAWTLWQPDFEFSCGATPDGSLLGDRLCRIQYDGKPHEATLSAHRDIEFLGYRITLTGIRRIQAIGGFQVAVDGAAGRALTTSTIGEPLDVFNTLDTANEANRLATLLLAGNTSESPVGLLPRPGLTAEQVGPLRVEAVPRTEIELRVVTTAHIPAFWGGVVLLLLGVLIITCVPAYRVRLYRSSDGHGTLNIEAAGLLARPKRLLEPIEKQWTQLDNSETDSVDVDRTPSEGPA